MTNDEILQQIPSFPQTQESLTDQLRLLVQVAVQLGCYDAADFINYKIRSKEKG
jgi:hypothetical protein